MQKIPLDLARPGMVLAKPVTRSDGIAVAAQGTELTESLLDRLEMMAVTHVVVEGEPVAMEGPAGTTSFDKRLERLDYLFRRYQGDAWMEQIKSLLARHFRMKAAAKAAAGKPGGGAPA